MVVCLSVLGIVSWRSSIGLLRASAASLPGWPCQMLLVRPKLYLSSCLSLVCGTLWLQSAVLYWTVILRLKFTVVLSLFTKSTSCRLYRFYRLCVQCSLHLSCLVFRLQCWFLTNFSSKYLVLVLFREGVVDWLTMSFCFVFCVVAHVVSSCRQRCPSISSIVLYNVLFQL